MGMFYRPKNIPAYQWYLLWQTPTLWKGGCFCAERVWILGIFDRLRWLFFALLKLSIFILSSLFWKKKVQITSENLPITSKLIFSVKNQYNKSVPNPELLFFLLIFNLFTFAWGLALPAIQRCVIVMQSFSWVLVV